jgi:hypothetical protein
VGASIAATAVGGFVSYVAAQHNPDGEFNGVNGQLSITLLFKDVFIWYFVPVFLFGLLIGLVGQRAGSKP